MRIGIDIRTLLDKHYSGVSQYTYNLLQNLFKLDKENEYFLFFNAFHVDLEKLSDIKNFAGEHEIKRTHYPNKLFNYFLQKTIHYPRLDKVLGDVDIFFAPHINFLSLSKNCRKILTVHDLSFLRYPEFFSVRKNFWHRNLNIKKQAQEFDFFVTVSENTKTDIEELLKIPREKIKVISSGIGEEYKQLDQIKFKKKLKQIKNKYALPDNYIFYLGNIEPRKNIQGLIEAFSMWQQKYAQFQSYELVLAGGEGWSNKEIYRAWSKSFSKNKIKFLGYVDDRDKVYLYNLAKIFVYPSFYEGFGFPPLEAMACGTVTVLGANSSQKEIVGTAAMTIDSDNIYSLEKAFTTLLSDNKIYEEYQRRGLEHVKKYQWQITATKYIDFFKSCC